MRGEEREKGRKRGGMEGGKKGRMAGSEERRVEGEKEKTKARAIAGVEREED